MDNNTNIILIEKPNIKNMIYIIRGQQVMLDSDLADLYGYEVKRLNEQVKRNIERFPEDFMFQLTKDEFNYILKSQIVTSSWGGVRKMPYAFTEQGIYMLSSVLRGEIAVNQSIMIMRTFKEMRHYINENRQLLNNPDLLAISHKLVKHEEAIHRIENTMATKDDINEIMKNFINEDKIKQFIIIDGQKFEANEAYAYIYRQAKHSIYIIDDYVNIDTLTMLKHKNNNINTIIFSDNKGKGRGKLRKLEYNHFNKEYPTLIMKRNNGKSHDRYIILDYQTKNEKVFHCGASSKDAGNKLCGINEIMDSALLHPVIDELLEHENYIF